MWTNEQPMTVDEMQKLNMVLAKGLRPAENPEDQALIIHAKCMYLAYGRNYPWEGLSQKTKNAWVNHYQRELKKAWGPFDTVWYSIT